MSDHEHEFIFIHGFQEQLPDGKLGKIVRYDIPKVKCDHCDVIGSLYESQVEYLIGYDEAKKKFHDRIWGKK